MHKFLLALSFGMIAANAATIDSGMVSTSPYFISDASMVTVNIGSSDGAFSLFGDIPGGGNLFCQHEMGSCVYGTYSFQAFFPDLSTYASAYAVIDGTPLGLVTIACPFPGCPHTFLGLIAQPVLISSPGFYDVPFTASGKVQASAVPGVLILDQPVDGVGSLYFSVSEVSPGFFQVDRNLVWNFAAVPEPRLTFVTFLVLVPIWLRQRAMRAGPRRLRRMPE